MNKVIFIERTTHEPKPGDLFRIPEKDGYCYILALVGVAPNQYCAISLSGGERWTDPVRNIQEAVDGLEYMGAMEITLTRTRCKH